MPWVRLDNLKAWRGAHQICAACYATIFHTIGATVAEIAATMAKLAGFKKSIDTILALVPARGVQQRTFPPMDVETYFSGVARAILQLRNDLPELYGDFPNVEEAPDTKMGEGHRDNYSRRQLERLSRHVDQAIEIRVNSELAAPAVEAPRRVFISHGRATDWREVQMFIERDIDIKTLELAQEPNKGLTVLGKLAEAAENCDSAVIVMTGDDTDSDGQVRARENVMHEIGYFQGKYGLSRIVLLHEDGVNMPSNIHGLVYLSFPKGLVGAAMGALYRELKHMYR
jgi:predicted nucleotide-binding protein